MARRVHGWGRIAIPTTHHLDRLPWWPSHCGPYDPRRLEMFYSVASPDWKPGQPLTPSGALLFRTRSEAELFAPEAPTVAVAVRFDPRRSEVRPQGPVASATAGPWSAPAVGNSLGGVTVFGSIPASLVRPSVEFEGLANWRPAAEDDPSNAPRTSFGGWDSLTMALLA